MTAFQGPHDVSVCVCIPTFDRQAGLRMALDGLCAQALKIPFAVVVANNLPGDARVGAVIDVFKDWLDVHLADVTERGVSAVRNQAIAVALAQFPALQWIAFQDDDEVAAKAFPDVTFHVIGAGSEAATLAAPNMRIYDEMKFQDTIPYLRHADFGVAPCLVDTWMKLIQYGYLGLPAVCPTVVAGDKPGRFGYLPGDTPSIASAMRSALDFGRFKGEPALSWREVTDRILDPVNV